MPQNGTRTFLSDACDRTLQMQVHTQTEVNVHFFLHPKPSFSAVIIREKDDATTKSGCTYTPVSLRFTEFHLR